MWWFPRPTARGEGASWLPGGWSVPPALGAGRGALGGLSALGTSATAGPRKEAGGGGPPGGARWGWGTRRRAVEEGSPAACGSGGPPGGARWGWGTWRHVVEVGSPAARGGGRAIGGWRWAITSLSVLRRVEGGGASPAPVALEIAWMRGSGGGWGLTRGRRMWFDRGRWVGRVVWG